MSLVNVNAIEPSTGTDITLGASGDTITIPSGATFTQSGTMNASAITAGTMATARLGSGTASSSVFLRGDSSWVAAGGNMTPAFFAKSVTSTDIGDATWTKLPFDSEILDTDGDYDPSTNYRFTPTTSGNYYFHVTCSLEKTGNVSSWINGNIGLYKNGSIAFNAYHDNSNDGWGYAQTFSINAVINMNGSSDYVEVYGYVNTNDGVGRFMSGSYGMFGGYKILE